MQIITLLFFLASLLVPLMKALNKIPDYLAMCTVTFIPGNNNNFILTSNRDEAPNRDTLAPQKYSIKNSELVFPKDTVAGGTWIGLSSESKLICLLNGGFKAHERKERYRMSRGVVVRDLLTSEPILDVIKNYDFTDIEPFTIILVTFKTTTKIFELVWDGMQAHFSEKPLQPQIWSSSLLYTETVKQQREHWFSSFLFETIKPTTNEILTFHHEAGTGDIEQDLIMDRGFVKTRSITQVIKEENEVVMNYQNIETQEQTKTRL